MRPPTGGYLFCSHKKMKRMMKMEKDLTVKNVEEAKKKVSDIEVYGDGDTFALLCKASSKEQGWMKSTKVCNTEDGCIVQVTTQQKNPDGSYALAEALTYVPNMHLNKDIEPRRLEEINWRAKSARAMTPDCAKDEPDKRWVYQEYLGLLLSVQNAGHDVHKEINETLEKLNALIFKA